MNEENKEDLESYILEMQGIKIKSQLMTSFIQSYVLSMLIDDALHTDNPIDYVNRVLSTWRKKIESETVKLLEKDKKHNYYGDVNDNQVKGEMQDHLNEVGAMLLNMVRKAMEYKKENEE